MHFDPVLSSKDEALRDRATEGFLPAQVADIHAHLCYADGWDPAHTPDFLRGLTLGQDEYRRDMSLLLHGRKPDPALLFGFPARNNHRQLINSRLSEDCKPENFGLVLASPADSPDLVAGMLSDKHMVGIKPYHLYASPGDTSQAGIPDFVPEWMWDLCHRHQGILMLHIMKDAAASDPENIAVLREWCARYPECQVILAHIARSFNQRNADGLRQLADIPNLHVDTSAITEAESIRRAIEVLGVNRVLYGSDYPVSHLRGRCVSTGAGFRWIYGTEQDRETMTLVGIESLLSLRQAAEDLQLSATEIRAIFHDNAQRILKRAPAKTPASGPARWQAAKTVISCGTGLRSKWAENFDPATWPAYYSRCQGSTVWDTEGRAYTDFMGGIGSILLGFADPDVNLAVQQRVRSGSYCSLVSPDEPELAELLLGLHPWAGRVRFARGGGEGMGVAVRIARAATGRSGIAFCGYHGWHDWYLSANLADASSLDGQLLPGLKPIGVPRELKGTSVPFHYNNKAEFEETLSRLDGRLAAVVMEPMRSQFPDGDFLHYVARRCREAGAVLVFDEVTSGWRFGFPGAAERLGVIPDIAVYAKASSNGYPFAAVLGKTDVMDAACDSFISSSYWTDGIGPAAALACIKKMRDVGCYQKVWQLGEYFQNAMHRLAMVHTDTQLSVGGVPALPTLAFGSGKRATLAKTHFIRSMLNKGYLTNGASFFLMLSHSKDNVDGFLAAMDETLAEIVASADHGNDDETTTSGMLSPFARLA